VNLIRILLFALVTLQACSDSKEILTIATSSNMQIAMDEIRAKFVEESNIECEIVYSSSGKLFAQIKEGAPYDVFVSADMDYPKRLYEEGITSHSPVHYGSGILVLFGEGSDAFDILTNSEVNHIAIANPKTAPYGRASKEFLQKLGVFDKLKSKLVYGENIQQTTQFIETGAAEIGITSKAFIHVASMKNRTWIELDSSLYQPIKQGVVILTNRSDNIEKARQFQAFLLSETSREILKRFGYLTK